jgi:hypothetical protein
MSDLRARLADALHRELDEHGYEDDDEKRGQVAHHFADVLLSLPGIAIVDTNALSELADKWDRQARPARSTSWSRSRLECAEELRALLAVAEVSND